jgi:Ribbon-helix-helix protein, copG family
MTRSRAAGMRSRHPREKAKQEKLAPPTGLTRLCVWFPADQMAALRALAAKRKQTDTALVREAVRRLLETQRGEG